MAYSYVQYAGNGVTSNFTFPFTYLDKAHIKVSLDGVQTTAFSFLNDSTISFNTAPTVGSSVEIRRVTPKDVPIVDFQDGSVILEKDLDLLATFNLYVSQETDDLAAGGLFIAEDDTFDADGKRISNVADPVNPQDAVTRNYVDTGMTNQLVQAQTLVTQATALVEQADTIISSFTVSTSNPTGGTDGDVWFKVTV